MAYAAGVDVGSTQTKAVIINEDGSITVQDNGRGIPIDYHEKEKKSALEVVMTVLHAGGKFNKDSYKVSGGLHGVGVSCVNALSMRLEAKVYRDGKVYSQKYEKGKPVSGVEVIGESSVTGTEITFIPDNSIFTTVEYNFEILATRLRELAFLNKKIRLTLVDKRKENYLNGNGNGDGNGVFRKETYYSEGGLKEFVAFLDATREKLISKPIYIDTEKNGMPVEIAMQYNTSFTENIHRSEERRVGKECRSRWSPYH